MLLRAIVSLGKFSDPRAVPSLLRGLTDANRLVRLRAAEALVDLKKDMAPIFERVVETGDRYGLHAYLTALENSNLREKLDEELGASPKINQEARDRLRKVLRTATLLREEPAIAGGIPEEAVPPQ